MLVSDYLGILWLIQVETKLSETLLKYLRSVVINLTNFHRTISNFYFLSKRFIDLYSDDEFRGWYVFYKPDGHCAH